MIDELRKWACWLAVAAFASVVPGTAFGQESSAAQAEAAGDDVSALIPTSAFAARSIFSSVPELSPDGANIAFSLSENGRSSLAVMPVDGEDMREIPVTGGQEIEWFRWAGSRRLLWSSAWQVNLFGIPLRYNNLYTFDLDSGESRQLGEGRLGSVSDQPLHIDADGQFLLLAMQPELGDEPEVWRFPLDGSNDQGTKVEGRRGVWRWIADDAGVVRVGLGIAGNRLKVWYRKGPEEEFRVVAKVRPGDTDEMWDLVRLIAGSDEGFVLEPGPSGRMALRRFNYATREIGEVIYENPEWDLATAELDESGHPVAVHFTDDRDRVVWLDPEMARLQERFQRALGTATDVRIAGRSQDGSRFLVAKGSASDPGGWYIYTRATRELREFAQLRPELDPALLAPVRPVAFTARDGTAMRGYLTLPRDREAGGLPLIVLPHGGPYGIRDKLEYSDVVQLLANRGYAVLQPNFRGSAGFGEAFEELGQGEIGRRMQDDLDDAVAWAAAEGIADPRRVCMVGYSYGGYAALWGAIRNPELYRCAASFAGVTEWDKQLQYDGSFIDRKNRRAWRDRIRGQDRKFDLDSVSPARQAARLTRPVLLVHGKLDATVPFSQFETMRRAIERARIPGAEFLVVENAGHGFFTPEDEQVWYDALIAFLAKHNPPDPAASGGEAAQSPPSLTTSS
jgi:dipeptidyl aminopeptidase/acylaminoacyl peptidase